MDPPGPQPRSQSHWYNDHQHQPLLCQPAGVEIPVFYQGVAGDPLARGEEQAGGRGVLPTTDEEAVHGVVVSLIRKGGEGAGQTCGGDKDFHTLLSIISTRQW